MLSDAKIARAIVETLSTPDEQGKGSKPRDANATDALYAIAEAIQGLANAIERGHKPRSVPKPRLSDWGKGR
jgi:hypothetical protein